MKALSQRVRIGICGRQIGGLVAALLLLLAAVSTPAAIKEIEAKGRYHLGDNDSKLVGHRLAMLEAKRNALEKAGTYVQSITEVKDYQLTRDEIRTYSAGILRVEETREPEWVMVGRNLEVTVYVKVQVDDQDVARKIGALREDKEATRELTEARKKVVENEKKIVALNKELKKAKKGSASAQRAEAQRSEAIDGIDSSTLKAQAAVAQKFGVQAYQVTKAYVQRQIPAVKGCYRSAFSSAQSPARPDRALALLGAPPVALLLWRPRKAGGGNWWTASARRRAAARAAPGGGRRSGTPRNQGRKQA
jgi:hypothetical protein